MSSHYIIIEFLSLKKWYEICSESKYSLIMNFYKSFGAFLKVH
jgi:hypothetical protein